MATRKIETTIALDGEQQFKQALASASREMRVMESEARALSAAYDQNGDAAAFFASRQQNLRNQIQQQEQIVSALEKAVRDSAETYGEASDKTDGWTIKLNNARTRLSKLQKELEATDREAEELGRDSVKVGRQIENGIGDGAREAEDSVNSLFEAMQRDIASIRTSGAITAVSTLWDRASSAYSSVESFVSGTAEYRKQLSFLQQNAESKGFDFSKIKEQLIEVQALTGDSSSAVEGLSNLLAIDISEEQMVRAVDELAGAVIRFPDTVKFESLANSLQETLATGEATGQFAELLERMGYDLDEFNAALEKSPTAAGDMEIALAHMAAGGLNDVYTKWQETNQAMVDAQKTQAAIEMELAEFAGTLEKYIVGPAKEAFLGALQYVNDTVEIAETEGVGAAIEKVGNDIESIADVVEESTQKTIEEIGASLYAGLPEWAQKAVDAVAPVMQEMGEMLTDPVGYGIQLGQALKGLGADSGGTEGHIETLSSLLAGRYYGEGEQATITGPEGESYIAIAERNIDEMIAKIQKTMETGERELQQAGEDAGEAVEDGFSTGTEGMEDLARSMGSSVGLAFGAGLASQVSYVTAASSMLAAAAAAGIRAAGTLGNLQKVGSTSVPLVINLDGRQVGTGLAPYSSEFMASSLDYDVNIN